MTHASCNTEEGPCYAFNLAYSTFCVVVLLVLVVVILFFLC